MKSRRQEEFGDFQTPPSLARQVCRVLADGDARFATILEPTCGRGSLLTAALQAFPDADSAWGTDINPRYVEEARQAMARAPHQAIVRVETADFFARDWEGALRELADPLLVVGNPPWVTNSALGSLHSLNLPEKTNAQGRRGIEALTGKSNFDISEWMLLRLCELLEGRTATLAMLCKTAVARRVLEGLWTRGAALASAEMRSIDALREFAASVDACLLKLSFAPGAASDRCLVYPALESCSASSELGLEQGRLVADVARYRRRRGLEASHRVPWRSGIKHDCSKVMEFRRCGEQFLNGFGELVSLEPEYLFPLWKSSQLASGNQDNGHRWMLVTQQRIKDDTADIAERAPLTWDYLQRHSERLDQRKSSIYRRRPRFSIFGVGDYAFAPWKVAISGLYKRLRFRVIGPVDEKPPVLDDTCCFLPCASERQADLLLSLLHSESAQEFLQSLIFWDAKRPITVETLGRLDLGAVADDLGVAEQYRELNAAPDRRPRQTALFPA